LGFDYGEDGNWKMIDIHTDKNELNKIKNEIDKTNEKFKSIFEQSPIGIELFDNNYKLVLYNKSIVEILGLVNADEIIGFDLFSGPNIPKDEKKKLIKGESVKFESDFSFDLVRENKLYNTTKEGIYTLNIAIIPLQSANNKLVGYICYIQDFTKSRNIEAELRKSKDSAENLNNMLSDIYEELVISNRELKRKYYELEQSRETIRKNEERYRLVFEASSDNLWDIDLITGEKYTKVESYGLSNVRNQNGKIDLEDFFIAVHPSDIKEVKKSIEKLRTGESDSFLCEYRVMFEGGEYKWVRSKGKIVRDSSGDICRIAGADSDINEKKTQQEQIEKLAYYDSLTGLENRSQFIKKFKRIAEHTCSKAALLFMDIDNFKIINDSYGHTVGDNLLIEVAKRISSLQTKTEVVARLGGDEFAILLTDIKDKAEVIDYINMIFNILTVRISINDIDIDMSISMGVAMFPENGDNLEDILKNADTAMYKAKELGKKRYVFFQKSMNDVIISKLLMVNHLRSALTNDEFILFYQPLVDLTTGKINGFEALIRWNSPIYGMVSPLDFIGLAEETGFIIPLGEWVIETACNFIKAIHTNGYENLHISVNVSVIQLKQYGFVDMVMKVLKSTGLNPKYLNLEITESILMQSIESNIKKIQELRNNFISISLDDFGKGYSSLTYLKQIPLDILKIDKSFTDEIIEKEENKDIIGAIITLAHKLGLKVITEGVEKREQYDYLSENNCDMMQGYYISKPLPDCEIYKLLHEMNE
jgi:diguanylate cyclase (GGDEF)-like protein/PAS domain S-box-containing protein